MAHSPRPTALRILALAGMAGLAALISNAIARPSRRLAWASSIAPLPPIPPRIERPQAPEPAVAAPAPPPPVQPEADPARPATLAPRATAPPPPVEPKSMEAGPSNPITEISSQEAWRAFRAGVPFLDARRSAEFVEGHIAGAWSAPIWESDLDDRLISFKAARHPGPEDPIAIYCSGGDCRDSHLLAARLLNEGYFHLLIYRGGFPDWVAQGHPVAKGQP